MDELEISGKLYISSKKAARQNKYHADYIGQLIRGGKIVGTKVGRAWYVEAASLASYLNEDPKDPKDPKEPEESVLKKNNLHAESSLENHEFSEKKPVSEAPVLKIAPRVGLTYLSETDFSEDRTKTKEVEQETEAGTRVHIHKNTPPETSAFSDPGDFGASLPRRWSFQLSVPQFSVPPFLGRIFFGLVTVGAFVALFAVSYEFSYTASLVDGQEASAVSFMQ